MQLANKNIILTGASSGIGKRLLEALCEYEGVKIVAVARNIDHIPKVFNKVFAFSADLSTHKGIDAMFDYGKNIFGEIDVFIANAGFAYIEELDDADWDHINAMYALNVSSVAYSLVKLNKQTSDKPKLFACTISAVAFVPLHAYALYCSSKAALHQFVESFRYEKKENLTISAIYPVATKTAFFDHASGSEATPCPWPAQHVETVVSKIIKGIEKDKKRIFPSSLFRIFYPIARAFPFFLKLYSWAEQKKTRKWLGK